jgi:hypothetical protein
VIRVAHTLSPWKTELAVLNNIRWYEAIFDAHGLSSTLDGMVWMSHEAPPPFHSNLVVLSPSTSGADIEGYVLDLQGVLRHRGWSMKDSYARLDLSPHGFTQLFQAHWIWHDPIQPSTREEQTGLVWAPIANAAELAEWEDAWSGDARNNASNHIARQFPDRLLATGDHVFFAGTLEGRIVAGGIANRSPGVVGLSNMFSPAAFAGEKWVALVNCISASFPNTPIVGYERDAELQLAKSAAFSTIGPLRVWQRSA